MKHFRVALRFLTRYPASGEEELSAADFGRSTAYFPLVGFLAGLDLLLLRGLLLMDGNGLHYPIWCVALLLFWIWSCGSLHLDGLADTADALASRRRGSEFLEILHDSRVGSFGALSLALALLAKYVWLSSLPMQACWFLPLPLIFSRLHSALACQIRPYGGRPGSLSSFFILEAKHSDLNLALGLGLGSFLALALPSVFWGLCSPMDAAKALGVGLLGLGLGRFLLRIPMGRLGGISGDLLGWSQVITEISVAFGLTLALVK